MSNKNLSFDYKLVFTPLLSGLIGILSGVLLASNQARIEENQFFLEKQAEVADLIGKNFPIYIDVYRRIISLGKDAIENDGEISSEERERMDEYISERKEVRDLLYSSLDLAHLYFGQEVSTEIYDFRLWDEPFQSATVSQLPTVSEWRARQMKIFSKLRSEISE